MGPALKNNLTACCVQELYKKRPVARVMVFSPAQKR